MEKMVATKQLRLAMEMDEERRARLEHLSANQHLGEKRNGFDMDFIWY